MSHLLLSRTLMCLSRCGSRAAALALLLSRCGALLSLLLRLPHCVSRGTSLALPALSHSLDALSRSLLSCPQRLSPNGSRAAAFAQAALSSCVSRAVSRTASVALRLSRHLYRSPCALTLPI
ncbi:hypothetical protein AB1Y20_009515 [Prymnesium parvum]|uniref:Secreted protein n=1 Tax=Prymnesium parvum TaxID=97485 RepID=A0AB34K2D3_PRYPA